MKLELPPANDETEVARIRVTTDDEHERMRLRAAVGLLGLKEDEEGPRLARINSLLDDIDGAHEQSSTDGSNRARPMVFETDAIHRGVMHAAVEEGRRVLERKRLEHELLTGFADPRLMPDTTAAEGAFMNMAVQIQQPMQTIAS